MERSIKSDSADKAETSNAVLGKKNKAARIVQITVPDEAMLNIPLSSEDGREYAVLLIDNVRYHLERISARELNATYRIDLDPEYKPQSDASGYCYMLVPFSR